ncbi:MAG: PorT family protein [Prevotella sp.]|nr:PorT family protein [Prevotella sp.]
MRVKKMIVVCCMLLSAVAASAQGERGTVSFIPRVGVTLANLSDMEVYVGVSGKVMDTKMRVGVSVGGDVEYQALSMLGVSLGAHYMLQGCHHEKVGEFGGKNTDIHYLNFPLVLNGYIGSGFTLHAGVQLGVKLGEKSLDNAKLFKSTDVSIPLGVSFERNRFIVDARYNLGVSNIDNVGFSDVKNNVIVLSLGYRL